MSAEHTVAWFYGEHEEPPLPKWPLVTVTSTTDPLTVTVHIRNRRTGLSWQTEDLLVSPGQQAQLYLAAVPPKKTPNSN